MVALTCQMLLYNVLLSMELSSVHVVYSMTNFHFTFQQNLQSKAIQVTTF